MLSYLAIPFDRFNWSHGVKVKAQVIERFSLMEELWIVAKDDTPNTLFRTGIARSFCHKSLFAFSFI